MRGAALRVQELERKLADAESALAAVTRTHGRKAKDHGGISSDQWCTGPDIADPLFELWDGPCDVDPCSNERSIVRARSAYTFGGLTRPWGLRTYENFPYSTAQPWADKSVYEMKAGRVQELVVLCMTATSTRWWKTFMTIPRRNPRVVHTKRLRFLGADGTPQYTSRFEPVLIYYGARTSRFDRLFAHVANWSTWGR